MQGQLPLLPVVRLHVRRAFHREQDDNVRKLPVRAKDHSPCRSTSCPSLKEKCLRPLVGGGPYRNSVRLHSLMERTKSNKKSAVGQRVTSAKMLRFKELENQLADAHYRLNDLATENRLLKALQKRQDTALKRYEGTNAELPRIINSHHEELRALRTKYKKLKSLYKETCDLLKERENELRSLQTQNKHLLQLSRDRNLGEREKLQTQVSDLNHRLDQQQQTIQLLNRKLALQTKSTKHRLNAEIAKHKDTQKRLQETLGKLTSLESLLDNREKRRFCYNDRLPIYARGAHLETRSLTNLGDVRTSPSRPKSVCRDNEYENESRKDSLPLPSTSESNDDDDKADESGNAATLDRSTGVTRTETMTSLEQVRKYRLQRLEQVQPAIVTLDEFKQKLRQKQLHTINDQSLVAYRGDFHRSGGIAERDVIESVFDRGDTNECPVGSIEREPLFESAKNSNVFELSDDDLNQDLSYCTDYGDTGNAIDRAEDQLDNNGRNPARKSRELHARLINGTNIEPDVIDDTTKEETRRPTEKEAKGGLTRSAQLTRLGYKNKSDSKQPDKYSFHNVGVDKETHSANCSISCKKNAGSLDYCSDTSGGGSGGGLNSPDESKVPERKEEIKCYVTRVKSDHGEDIDLPATLGTRIERTMLSSKDEYVSKQLDGSYKRGSSLPEKKPDGSVDRERDSDNIQRLEGRIINLPNRPVEKSTPDVENPFNEDDKHGREDHGSRLECKKHEDAAIDGGRGKGNDCKHTEDTETDIVNAPAESDYVRKGASEGRKAINYNKEKLLAKMKAIDDNENVEFLDQREFRRCNAVNRMRVTENLFRGLPARTETKQDI